MTIGIDFLYDPVFGQTNLSKHADPDQTSPRGALLSGSSL